MPGGFGTSKGGKAVYFSLVSPLDQNPDPKYKPYTDMMNHHDRLLGIDLEAAQNSLEFHQTANGSVLCYDTVLAEFLTMFINIKDGSERFVKEVCKEEESSPTKGSRRDRGGTSWHEVEQEALETRQLGKNSRSAEVLQENKSSKVYVQRYFCSNRMQIRNMFLQMWQEVWRLDS